MRALAIDTDNQKRKQNGREVAGETERPPFLPVSLYDVAFDGLDFNTLEHLTLDAKRYSPS